MFEKFKSHSLLVSFLMIALLGIVFYSNSFNADFQFDDRRTILERPAVQNPLDPAAIWGFDPKRALPNWSFAVNYHLHQDHVFGYHLINLLFHILTCLLCFLIVSKIFESPYLKNHRLAERKELIGITVALLFLVHPVQTQAVTYIVQRSTIFAAFFYLLSLYLAIQSHHKQSHSLYLFALLTGLLSMLCKQNAYTLPFAILLYGLLFFEWKNSVKSFYFYHLPFFILPLLAYLFTYHGRVTAEGLGSVLNVQSSISHSEYALTQLRVVLTYIRLLFLPINQSIDYAYPISRSFAEPQTFVSALAHAGIIFAGFRCLKRHRIVSFGIFWFYLTLSIESGLVNIADVIYEHRLYLPMLGFGIVIAYFIFNYFYLKFPLKRTVITMGFIVMVLGALTFKRNFVWANEMTLWVDAANKHPNKSRLQYAAGNAYLHEFRRNPENKNLLDEATHRFQESLRLSPNYMLAHNSLGTVYLIKGDAEKALEHFEKAVKLSPDYEDAKRNITMLKDILTKPKAEQDRIFRKMNISYDIRDTYDNTQTERDRTLTPSRKTSQRIRVGSDSIRMDPSAEVQDLGGGQKLIISPPKPDSGSTEPIYSLHRSLAKGQTMIMTPVDSAGKPNAETTFSLVKNEDIVYS